MTKPGSNPGWALQFDGKTNYLAFNLGPKWDNTPVFTVETWINPKDGKLFSINQGEYYKLTVVSGALVIEGRFSGRSPNLPLDQWIHLAIVCEEDPQPAVKIYVNGEPFFNQYLPNYGPGSVPTNIGGEGSLSIGSGDRRASYFSGAMASFALWKGVRLQEEIQQDMRDAKAFTSPTVIAWWTFSDGAGEQVSELNGHHAQIMGTPVWVQQKEVVYGPKVPQQTLNRLTAHVDEYHSRLMAQAQATAQERIQKAHELHDQRVQAAQQQASNLVNTAKFDYIGFLEGGRIKRLREGQVEEHRLIAVDAFTHEPRMWQADTEVYDLLLLPNGTQMAAAGKTSIQIWDILTGQLLHTLKLNGEYYRIFDKLALSSDNRYLIYGPWVWDVQSWSQKLSISDKFGSYEKFIHSQNGGFILRYQYDEPSNMSTLSLWDTQTFTNTATLRLSGRFDPLAVTFDGHMAIMNTVSSGPRSGVDRLEVWNISTSSRVASYNPEAYIWIPVVFTPDNRYFVYVDTKLTLYLCLASSAQVVRKVLNYTAGPPIALTFTPDGHSIILHSAEDRALVQRNIDTWATERVFSGSEISSQIHLTADQRYLIYAWNTFLHFCDYQTQKLLTIFGKQVKKISKFIVTPDSRTVVTASSDGTICVWDINTRPTRPTILDERENLDNPVFSPDKSTMVIRNGNGHAMLYDAKTLKLLKVLADGEYTDRNQAFIKYSNDSKRIVLGNYHRETLQSWDIERRVRLWIYHQDIGGGWFHDFVLLPGTSHIIIFTISDEGVGISRINPEEKKVIYKTKLSDYGDFGRNFHAIDITADGMYVVVACSGIHIVRAETGEEVHVFREDTHVERQLKITDDGKFLVSLRTREQIMRIYSLVERKQLQEFSIDMFSQNHKFMLLPNNIVILDSLVAWDIVTGQQVFSLVGPEVQSFDLTEDKRFLMGYCQDDTTHIWDLQTHEPITMIMGCGVGVTAHYILGRYKRKLCVWNINQHYLTDIAHDAATETLYLARNDLHWAVVRVDGTMMVNLYPNRPEPIHTLTIDQAGGEARSLYWIEGDGKIYQGRADGIGGYTLLYERAPAGRLGEWQIAVDIQRQALYWTNGREIWYGQIKDKALTDVHIIVSHAQSPYPLDLAIDDSTGWLYWQDRELEVIRRYQPEQADDATPYDTLYPAPLVRHGLALDVEMRHIYWNSHHRRMLEAAIIDDPGLFCWVQDLGFPSLYDRQHATVLEDWQRFGAQWQKAAAQTPFADREVLVFDGQDDYLSLGPLYLDLTSGFTLESWINIANTNQAQRLIDLACGAYNDMLGLSITPKGEVCFEVAYESGEVFSSTTVQAIRPGEWAYLVVLIDAAGFWRVYVNGEVVAWAEADVGALRPRNGLRVDCVVGKSNDPEAAEFFAGQVGLLRLWNNALTAFDIRTFYAEPKRDFREVLRSYHRTFLEHRTGPFLMRGHMDLGSKRGVNPEAQIVHPLATEGGLILQSPSMATHIQEVTTRRAAEEQLREARKKQIEAYQQLERTRQKASSDLTHAREAAHAQEQASRDEQTKLHAQATQMVAGAQADADSRRRSAQSQLAETRSQSTNRVEQAQRDSVRQREDAKREADRIKSQAYTDKNAMVNDANRELKAAQDERAKH